MRPIFPRFTLIAALACASPLPVAAQALSQGSDDETEIVVEGVRERQRQVQQFVDALTEAPRRGQIGRFDWEVCPVALGMTEPQNRAVTARMRRVAGAAGVPLEEAGCRGNAIVIVTPDKAETMRWLRRHYPAYFRNELGERIRLPDAAAPVTAWQVEGRLSQDGMPLAVKNDADGEDLRNANHYVVEVTRASSRINAASRPHFMASIVVIDDEALRGLTTTQLADYAAMRVFAKTQPSRLERSTAPTILNVIDAPMGAPVPVTLTQWDLGFLRALYGSAENRYAEQQRHEMRRQLQRELEQARETEAD